MIWRATLLALAAFVVLVALAGAATPEGPRLAISVSKDGPGVEDESSEVITTGPSGEDPQQLIDDPDYWGIGSRLSWSADGDLLAFSASGPFQSDPGGSFGTGWPLVAVANADGSGSRVFPRAFLNGGEPLIAPGGDSVVFQRVKLIKILPGRENYLFKSAIWSLDVETGLVRRLTRWRLAAFLDPSSYSSDGSTLAAELYDRRGSRAVAIDLHSRRLSPLARNALEPTYSPDGTKLAFVRLRTRYNDLPEPNRPVSELLVARVDGGGTKRLLRRRGFISRPSWDSSGSRLTFTRSPPDFTGSLEPEPGNKVMAINADGTCLTRVFTDPELTLHGAAWQPGAGREAGPISC